MSSWDDTAEGRVFVTDAFSIGGEDQLESCDSVTVS